MNTNITRDKLLSCLPNGLALSAPAIAELSKTTLESVLRCIAANWWSCQAVTGDWAGWRYQRRAVVSTTRPPRREVGEWGDVISHSKYNTK